MQRNISHPEVAVIMAILSVDEGVLKVALYERQKEPFKNKLSLPAGLIGIHESLDDAAKRVLKEKTGIDNVYLEQIHAFGEPYRDPAGRTVGIAYFAFVPFDKVKITQEDAEWTDVKKVPTLAFDHSKILSYVLKDIKKRILYSNIVHSLLPDAFTLTQLQKIYEIILNSSIDKRNFRKKILSAKIVEPTNKVVTGMRQRPAKLYKFTYHPLEQIKF